MTIDIFISLCCLGLTAQRAMLEDAGHRIMAQDRIRTIMFSDRGREVLNLVLRDDPNSGVSRLFLPQMEWS